MLKRISLVLIFSIGTQLFSLAQNIPPITSYDILEASEKVPSSPESSSLGEYGKTTATPYNGKANISVPLYTINFEGLQIPLQLTYDTGGVRVSQEASWVGLNWNLSSAFGISRQIYGKTDLDEYSGLSTGYIYHNIDCSEPSGVDYPYQHAYDDILRVHHSYSLVNSNEAPSNAYDTQPDIFSANIFGKSYTFILKKKPAGSSIVEAQVFDNNNVQITLDLANFSFTLLDENGFTYYFNKNDGVIPPSTEINTPFSSVQGDGSPAGTYQGAFGKIFADDRREDESLITNWSLDQVVAPNGKMLSFSYTKGLHFTFPQYYFNGDGLDIGKSIWPNEQREEVLTKKNHSVSTSVIENNYLNEISGDFGRIVFNLVGREDLCTGSSIDLLSAGSYTPGGLKTAESTIRSCHGSQAGCGGQESTSLSPLKLGSIYVEDQHQNRIVDVQFSQSYFNSDKVNESVKARWYRLKLDSVQVNEKKYRFNYINPNYLPAKDSDGIDFWGFANGMEDENDGIVPRIGRFVTDNYISFPSGDSKRVFQQFVKYQGADRRSRFNHAKAGLLNGMIYPTGGATEFIYEPHEIVMASPSLFQKTDWFNDYPDPGRYRWTNMTDEAKFNNTYHYLKNAKDPNYNYFELTAPSTPGSPIELDFRLNQIFNVEFSNSTLDIESYLKTETGWGGMSHWGSTVLLALEEVNTEVDYEIFYYNQSTSQPGDPPNYVSKFLAIPPGDYRLVRRNIFVPNGDYWNYPPTPGISTNFTKVILNTYEADEVDINAVLERFEIGGARIKKIIHRDVQGKFLGSTAYEYNYPDGFEDLSSSGKLMDELVFYQKTNGFFSYSPRGTGSFVLTGNNVLGGQPSAQGSHIGYSFVREYQVDRYGEHLGWIDREFHNLANKYHTTSFTLPYAFDGTVGGTAESSVGDVSISNTYVLGLPLRLSYGYANGNVLEERVYGSNGQLKRKVLNDYVYLNGNVPQGYFTSFKNYTLGYEPVANSATNLNHMNSYHATSVGPWGSNHDTYFSYQFPAHYGQISKLYSSKTIEYDGTPELAQATTSIFNDTTHFLEAQKATDSKEKEMSTEYYYPQDQKVASQSGMTQLVNENQLSLPVRTDTYLEDTLLNSQRTHYANNVQTGNHTLPISVETLKGIPSTQNDHFEERMQYEVFGPNGRVRQYRNTEGIPTALIWGYNDQYVVAKIVNATYDAVSSEASQIQVLSDADNDRTKGYANNEGALRQALDNLRNSLPSAQMVSYTYDPLIGVTSITNERGQVTYYEYDNFNRLESIKDQDGALLEDYQYQYSDAVYDLSFSESPYTDPDPTTSSGGNPGETSNVSVMINYGPSGATYQYFVAQPSGGDGNYTYEWFIGNGDSSTSFGTTPVGTGSSFTLFADCDTVKYVKVEVTSGNKVGTATRKNGNNPCGPGDDPSTPE